MIKGFRAGLLVVALLVASSLSAQSVYVDRVVLTSGPCTESSGTGSPETVITGIVCDTWHQTDTPYDIYRKTSGAGTTGWTKLSTGGTVTSVSMVAPSLFTWLGGPITTAGTFTGAWTAATAGKIPRSTGSDAAWSTTIWPNSAAAGDLLLATSANTFGSLATVAAGQVLASGPTPAYTASPSLTAIGGAAALTLNPTGNLLLNPVTKIVSLDAGLHVGGTSDPGDNNLVVDGNADVSGYVGVPGFASQTTGWRVTAAGSLDVRYLYTDELRAKVFTADLESVLAGSQRVTKSYSLTSQLFTCPAAGATATLWVADAPTYGDAAVFVAGDGVVMRAMARNVFGPFSIADCVGVVTAYADGAGANATQQSWTFTRNTGGNAGGMPGGTAISPGLLVQDLGTTGNGYVETSAVDGAAGINAPYTQIVTWATAPVAANLTVRARLGNLRGITGTGEYGLIAGTYAATNGQYFRASDQAFELHGIDLSLWSGGTKTVFLDHATPSFALGAAVPSAYGTGTGIWMGNDAGTYKFRVGVPGAAGVFWDGSTLAIAGAITATSGSIAGALSVGTGGSIASGATAYGTGTGLWTDYNAGTPRFRVGDPAGNQLAWDGTNLSLKSSTVQVNANGVMVTPATTGTVYLNPNGYAFGPLADVANIGGGAPGGRLGAFGFDRTTTRSLDLVSQTADSSTNSASVNIYAYKGPATGISANFAAVTLTAYDHLGSTKPTAVVSANTTIAGALIVNGSVTGYGSGFSVANTLGAAAFVVDSVGSLAIKNVSAVAVFSVAATTGNTAISGTTTHGGPITRSAAASGYLDGNYLTVGDKPGAIYTIGGTSVPVGATLGTMYGIGYAYQITGNPEGSFGQYVASNGVARIFLNSDTGNIYAVGNVDAVNFHSAAGHVKIDSTSAKTGTTVVHNADGFYWDLSSSEQVKNILTRDWHGDTAAFLKVQPIQFTYKADDRDVVIGFSAEDWQRSGVPFMLNLDKDGLPASYRQDAFLAYTHLIQQDHDARIVALEARLKEMH